MSASAESLHEDSDVFIAELDRLMRELREVGQQLDRIETQVRRAVNDATRERFERYH